MLVRIWGCVFIYKPDVKIYVNKQSTNNIYAYAKSNTHFQLWQKPLNIYNILPHNELLNWNISGRWLRKYLHNLSCLAVRASRQDLHSPQVVRWNDPGLQFQTHAAGVVTCAERLHSWGNRQQLVRLEGQRKSESNSHCTTKLTCDLMVLSKKGFIFPYMCFEEMWSKFIIAPRKMLPTFRMKLCWHI